MNMTAIEKTSKKPRRKRGGIYRTRQLQLYSLCVIPVLVVFVFKYLPMGGLVIAFKNYRYNKGIWGSDWVGLENFKFFFRTSEFANITWNTLYMNFLFIVIGIAASVLTAIALFRLTNRISVKVYQTALIIPHFFSWVVVSYMLYAFLNVRYGVMNNFLSRIGINPIDWYSTPWPWPVIFVIASLWKHLGMDCVVYYAALMGIDTSLIEAGEIDGASKRQIMRHIIIPSLVPLITIMTILKIGNIFRADFGLFYQLPRDSGALYSTTDVVDTYIFRAMREIGDMGMSAAVGLLQSLVGMVLVLITNTLSKKVDPDTALF